MAASVVVLPLDAQPGPTGGLNITYSVAFAKDNGALDMDLVTVELNPGDSPNTINGKISTAVRARASALNLAIPANGIAIPAYTKG